MKKSSMLILLLVATGIALIVALFGKISTYATFTSARQSPGSSFQVIGILDTLQPAHFDTAVPDHFIFTARDKNGTSCKVVLQGPPPAEFAKSKQLVITGYIQQEFFYCNQVRIRG
ncbi:cytochrome c maturation protein CcmE [Taibaiella chishuiensis]|nr:cytochrome c maturation protein CcmE [Taibaiella chishuiensis]